MAKIYTKIGDFGCTMIKDRQLSKDTALIDAIGGIDELQASLDTARLYLPLPHASLLEKIQDKLRFLAGELAGYVTEPEQLITEEDILHLEEAIDEIADFVPKRFVRFNTPGAIYLNEARVRTRALERKVVKLLQTNQMRETAYQYINRLSDLFFVLSYKLEFSLEEFARFGK